MKKSFDFIFSTRLMGVLILFFAFAMAVATFVENDYGTQTSKALIYNAWWFEAIMALLVINFIGNIFRYRLFRKEKWPVLLFHIAFIVILLGAFISRYFGFEGVSTYATGFQDAVSRIGMDYHFKSMSRGVLDTRDILYFISVAFLFLSFTVFKLKSLKS